MTNLTHMFKTSVILPFYLSVGNLYIFRESWQLNQNGRLIVEISGNQFFVLNLSRSNEIKIRCKLG